MNCQNAPTPAPTTTPPRRSRRARAALIKEVRARVKARGYDLVAIVRALLADEAARAVPAAAGASLHGAAGRRSR